MKRILVLLTALTVALAFSAVTFAEEATMTEPANAATPAKTATKGSGEVTAVDAKAMTITVKAKKGEKVIAITDASKITVGKETKAIADVKVGDKVKVKVAKAAKNPCAKK